MRIQQLCAVSDTPLMFAATIVEHRHPELLCYDAQTKEMAG
jgi:hypothetical protein|tara:strand:+ start:2396 stop:2518 length:123 start_codon:yes stop_codon:yes gene_type:complete